MPSLTPSLTLDSPHNKLARYFLPWQLAWIEDDSRLRLWEKSVRIGATYCDVFKNVRKRLLHKNRDYLLCSKDMASAVEYLREADRLADIFNFSKYILSRGEELTTVTDTLSNGDRVTTEIKFNYMKFENGSRIIAFSSSPFAMAVYGGDVGGDEFAKHENQERLYETMQGRIRMGYVDKKEGPRLRLAGLFTCRTDDWNFLQTVLWTFHRRLSGLRSAGDETGVGRQICWQAQKSFPGQFKSVNFASEKHDMGFALMNHLSVAEKIFPKDQPDVAQDFFVLRKIHTGNRWKFTEGRNLLNPSSHCDIAWAGALASQADARRSQGLFAVVG